MAFECVGLPPVDIVAASDTVVRSSGVARLLAAATAALGVDEELAGRTHSEVLVRQIVAHLAAMAGIANSEVAWVLNKPARSVRRLRRQAVDEQMLVVVRRRLALENLVANLSAGYCSAA